MIGAETKLLREELEELKCRQRRLGRWLRAGALLWAGSLAALVAQQANADLPAGAEVLRVRGLIVVDEKGTERVIIGSPLPDPMILGKRQPRGEAVSGLMLLDGGGNERGGYVTSDVYPNVFLTLDSVAQQRALFTWSRAADRCFGCGSRT